MNYDIKKVREGLALIKVFRDTEVLKDSHYSSADIIEIMKHVRYLVGSEKLEIGKEGERILNDISMH